LGDYPSSFDAREKWGNCIHPIRDQGNCGSCWAHASTEALSDRFCISSNGEQNVILSPQELTSCDPYDGGCGGGTAKFAFNYFETHGVVDETCFPYAQTETGEEVSCSSSCHGTKYYCDKSSMVHISDYNWGAMK
jgi:cathepsin B